jgi:hypothetical protein
MVKFLEIKLSGNPQQQLGKSSDYWKTSGKKETLRDVK